jgi:hypothetical protein
MSDKIRNTPGGIYQLRYPSSAPLQL